MRRLIHIISQMRCSPIRNYVIPGLNSFLLENGKVRLFENERDHQESVTPHSHRFDFACLVLQGEVTNKIWRPESAVLGDSFMSSEIRYKGSVGEYDTHPIEVGSWTYERRVYGEGDVYSMKSDEIHSIEFSRNAKVLFFEGPTLTDSSIILEPYVNEQAIPTSTVQPYMFQRGNS